MTSFQIDYFLKVCETKNITAAAEQLSITQQGLSKSIRNLESELGVKLIEYSPSGFVLTKYGQAAKTRLENISRDIQELKHELREMKELSRSKTNIALLPGFCHDPMYHLDFIITSISDQKDINYIECSFQECERLVLEENADYGITLDPSKNSLLSSSILRDIPHYGVMSEDHILAQKKTLQIIDLEYESLVVLNDQYRSLSIFFEKCREAGIEPNISRKASEISSIFLICMQGKEIGIVPEFAIKDIQAIKGLVAIPFDETMCNHIYCIQKKNRKTSCKVFC